MIKVRCEADRLTRLFREGAHIDSVDIVEGIRYEDQAFLADVRYNLKDDEIIFLFEDGRDKVEERDIVWKGANYGS